MIEIIENTLRIVRREMDAVIFRASISPMIRETHDSYPLVADRNGRMLAGQFGWPLGRVLRALRRGARARRRAPEERSLPAAAARIQHTPDMLVLRPIFAAGELVGFATQLGNLLDIGGRRPGRCRQLRSIYEEGIRFPPVKLYDPAR